MEQTLDMSNHHIANVRTPFSNDHAANKLYVDDEAAKRLSRSGGTMLGDILTNGNKVTGLMLPTQIEDAATKQYCDNKLSKSGGTMSGDINMNNNKINNLITDYKDIKSSANVHTAKGDVTVGLKNYFQLIKR